MGGNEGIQGSCSALDDGGGDLGVLLDTGAGKQNTAFEEFLRNYGSHPP